MKTEVRGQGQWWEAVKGRVRIPAGRPPPAAAISYKGGVQILLSPLVAGDLGPLI